MYLAVASSEAVTDDKVAVDVFRIGQAAERSQLFEIAGLRITIVDFDAVPAVWGLGGLGRNSFFYGVEVVITGQGL